MSLQITIDKSLYRMTQRLTMTPKGYSLLNTNFWWHSNLLIDEQHPGPSASDWRKCKLIQEHPWGHFCETRASVSSWCLSREMPPAVKNLSHKCIDCVLRMNFKMLWHAQIIREKIHKFVEYVEKYKFKIIKKIINCLKYYRTTQ